MHIIVKYIKAKPLLALVKAVTRFFPWAKPHKDKGKTWDEVAADFNKILPAGHLQLVGTHARKQIEPDNIVFSKRILARHG